MVEFTHDTANQRCVCKTEKMSTNIIIEKETGGYRFFIVKFEVGSVPQELSGRYTSIQQAQVGVEKYLRNKTQSASVRRKEFGDAYEKRKKAKDAAKSKSKSSK